MKIKTISYSLFVIVVALFMSVSSLGAMHDPMNRRVPRGPIITHTPFEACVRAVKQLDEATLNERLKQLQEVNLSNDMRNYLRRLIKHVEDNKETLAEESENLAQQLLVNPPEKNPGLVQAGICGALALACFYFSYVDEDCSKERRKNAELSLLGGVGFTVGGLYFLTKKDSVTSKKGTVDANIVHYNQMQKLLEKKLQEVQGN